MKINFANGFIDGCFDLFHYGHINGIYQSKLRCKTLHLATHSNDEIFIAKNRYPIYDFNHRLALLKNCKFIDKLHIESTPYNTSVEIIDNMGCEVFFHAEDGIDKYPLLDINNANKLYIYDRTLGVSTSDILKRLYNYKNNIKVDTCSNYGYLTTLYNNISSFSKNKEDINYINNIICLNCNWDLFNKYHIQLIQKIKNKYNNSYKLIIDLTSYNENESNMIFNKFEIRILLAGIIGIYDSIINNNLDNNLKKIKCDNLILINSKVSNLFTFNNYQNDTTFNNDINDLNIQKDKIVNSINTININSI